MDKRGLTVVILIIAFSLLIAWFFLSGSREKSEVPIINQSSSECAVDSDCVPSSCCHASACVAKGKAPECSGLFCTQECVPGTLDCQQASCSCLEEKCKVVLN